MDEAGDDVVRKLFEAAVERARSQPPPPLPEPPTIHHTELPEGRPDSPLALEWSFYRRQVGQLLADGREGQFVLIKGEQIVGLYATEKEALQHGYQMYRGQAFLVHQIQDRERILRCYSARLCRD
jgi:hypothetical protein